MIVNGDRRAEYDAFVVFDQREVDGPEGGRLVCRIQCHEDGARGITDLRVQRGREDARDVPVDDAEGQRWLDLLRALRALMAPIPLAWGDV